MNRRLICTLRYLAKNPSTDHLNLASQQNSNVSNTNLVEETFSLYREERGRGDKLKLESQGTSLFQIQTTETSGLGKQLNSRDVWNRAGEKRYGYDLECIKIDRNHQDSHFEQRLTSQDNKGIQSNWKKKNTQSYSAMRVCSNLWPFFKATFLKMPGAVVLLWDEYKVQEKLGSIKSANTLKTARTAHFYLG